MQKQISTFALLACKFSFILINGDKWYNYKYNKELFKIKLFWFIMN